MTTKLNAQQQKEGYDSFSYYADDDMKDVFRDFHAARLAPIFERYVSNPAKILEIGFCAGRLMQWVHARYPEAKISGTEVRPQLVEKMKLQGFDCLLVEDETIPGAETYDLIYGTSVLHHFSAPYDFMRYAFARLNPGGVLVFSCEPNFYNLPCIAYSTLRRIWHLEKHLLKLTRRKVAATARELTDTFEVFFDDASYLAPFPVIHRFFNGLRLTRSPLFGEFHLVLVRDKS